jgi:hypothetical protein
VSQLSKLPPALYRGISWYGLLSLIVNYTLFCLYHTDLSDAWLSTILLIMRYLKCINVAHGNISHTVIILKTPDISINMIMAIYYCLRTYIFIFPYFNLLCVYELGYYPQRDVILSHTAICATTAKPAKQENEWDLGKQLIKKSKKKQLLYINITLFESYYYTNEY